MILKLHHFDCLIGTFGWASAMGKFCREALPIQVSNVVLDDTVFFWLFPFLFLSLVLFLFKKKEEKKQQQQHIALLLANIKNARRTINVQLNRMRKMCIPWNFAKDQKQLLFGRKSE